MGSLELITSPTIIAFKYQVGRTMVFSDKRSGLNEGHEVNLPLGRTNRILWACDLQSEYSKRAQTQQSEAHTVYWSLLDGKTNIHPCQRDIPLAHADCHLTTPVFLCHTPLHQDQPSCRCADLASCGDARPSAAATKLDQSNIDWLMNAYKPIISPCPATVQRFYLL